VKLYLMLFLHKKRSRSCLKVFDCISIFLPLPPYLGFWRCAFFSSLGHDLGRKGDSEITSRTEFLFWLFYPGVRAYPPPLCGPAASCSPGRKLVIFFFPSPPLFLPDFQAFSSKDSFVGILLHVPRLFLSPSVILFSASPLLCLSVFLLGPLQSVWIWRSGPFSVFFLLLMTPPPPFSVSGTPIRLPGFTRVRLSSPSRPFRAFPPEKTPSFLVLKTPSEEIWDHHPL